MIADGDEDFGSFGNLCGTTFAGSSHGGVVFESRREAGCRLVTPVPVPVAQGETLHKPAIGKPLPAGLCVSPYTGKHRVLENFTTRRRE